MTDEKVLIAALSTDGFKLSAYDKKRTEALELSAAEDTRKQFGEDLNPIPTASYNITNDKKSLLAIVKAMSASQRQQIIDLLKHNGLGDPLTEEKIVQNAFTVEKTIRDHASS